MNCSEIENKIIKILQKKNRWVTSSFLYQKVPSEMKCILLGLLLEMVQNDKIDSVMYITGHTGKVRFYKAKNVNIKNPRAQRVLQDIID